MFSRILVGVDGSEHGARALAVATGLAVAKRGRLTVMSIVPHPCPWAWGGGLGPKLARRSPVPVLVVPMPTPDVRGSERGRGRELDLSRVNRLHRHGGA